MESVVENLIVALSKQIIADHGYAYASGYLGSLCYTIASRLSDEEKLELVKDISARLASKIGDQK